MTEAAAEIRADAQVDVLVVGAGPVGLAFASALAAETARLGGTPLSVALIDRQAPGAALADPRALALAAGSRQILQALGAWQSLPATPIGETHVSQRGGFGRTLLAASDGGARAAAALGHVVRYGALTGALETALGGAYAGGASARRFAACTLAGSAAARDALRLTLADAGGAREIAARLVVHAEGESAAADTRVHDYGQCAIVAEVTPARAHGGRAWERFTGDGPLALLPLGADYSLVYTVRAGRVAALLGESDADFLARLRRDFGGRLDFRAIGRRAAFPLALRVRRQVVGERQVWIGAAAQTLHPVAGQGFNLGLRDAATLARALATRAAAGNRDPGDAAALAAWAASRRGDRYGTIAITDGLVRIFGSAPLAALRGAGLVAVDVFPPLRRALAQRMMFGGAAGSG